LEQIKKTHPEINIVIDDYSDGFTKELTEKQLLYSNHYQMMPSFFRFNRKSQSELIAEKHNKNIGVIYGYDKVRCSVSNGDFYSYFLDCIGGNNLDPSRTFEVFYWSPDFPQLTNSVFCNMLTSLCSKFTQIFGSFCSNSNPNPVV
jgi:hypothetical protein